MILLPHSPVQGAGVKQLLLPAAGGKPPLVDHQNLIRVLDGVQPVGHHDQGLAPYQTGDGLLDLRLALGVSEGGCLVQNDDGRLFEHGPGDGDALALSAESRSPRLRPGYRTLLQIHDKVMAVGGPGRGFHLRVGGAGVAHADILPDGPVKEEVVLGHIADLPHELVKGIFWMSCPPKETVPPVASQKPAISLAMVDFPEPEGPTMAVICRCGR